MTNFLTRTLLSLIVLTLLTLTSCKKAEELSTAVEPVAQQLEDDPRRRGETLRVARHEHTPT